MIKSNTPPEAITRRYIAPLVRVLVLAAFLVAAIQVPVDAATKSIKIVNRSGRTITAIYCTATGYGKWGGNRLNGSLGNGGWATVPVNTDRPYWDFKIVFSNGGSMVRRDIDVIRYSSFTINP